MAGNRGEGTGEAQDAGTATAPSDGTETAEEHEAKIQSKLREAADAAVEAAETMVEKTKAHAAGAEDALKEAKAQRAELGDE